MAGGARGARALLHQQRHRQAHPRDGERRDAGDRGGRPAEGHETAARAAAGRAAESVDDLQGWTVLGRLRGARRGRHHCGALQDAARQQLEVRHASLPCALLDHRVPLPLVAQRLRVAVVRRQSVSASFLRGEGKYFFGEGNLWGERETSEIIF